MSPSPALSVESLSYRYRNREEWALRDVSFTASPGEIILIAGASGSGKTTLIRCLNGLIPRSYKGGELTGTIHVEARRESGTRKPEGGTGRGSSVGFRLPPSDFRFPPSAFPVGTLLQDPERQIVGSRVANEVAFGLENLGVPRPEMRLRVEAVLARLGIGHLVERETASLSGGEKQKVALAGTLVMEPAVLLLDEPLANLDPASAREALHLFRRLAGEGHTLLLVEHRVEDALSIQPDQALYLTAGRQEYFGPLAGFLAAADPHEVKLPAPLAVAKLREVGVQAFRRSGVQDDTAPAPHHLTVPPAERPTARTPERLNARTPERLPLVEFDHVSFAYDAGAPVVRDVTAAIREGDVIAVLGPNGAGKSTLVRHAIGLVKPTSGTVRVLGRDTREMTTAELARTVGYVFQSPSHMLFAPTVREELAFGPRNLGMAEKEIAANSSAALAGVDLAGYEERAPLSLSFGQQKRVAIAAILAMQPRVLVMDEPAAGQDYRHANEFMGTILGGVGQVASLPEAGARQDVSLPDAGAILFITHDLDLAITFANRVWLVAEGRLVADGPPSAVLTDTAMLAECRLHPTSLLELNRELLPRTSRLHSLEEIAAGVVGQEDA